MKLNTSYKKRPTPLKIGGTLLYNGYSPPNPPLIKKKTFLFDINEYYYNKVYCDSSIDIGFIFGKEGRTIKKIQDETNTNIIWKKRGNNGYFSIRGYNLGYVNSATISIQNLIIKFQYKIINKLKLI